MRELPILFSTPMVQAIQENSKTMTRRTAGLQIVNECPNDYYFQSLVLHATGEFTFAPIEPNETLLRERIITAKPRYQKGDQLWVKETFCHDLFSRLVYRAKDGDTDGVGRKFKWISSLFMRKEYARIWLEVTEVRCERLHTISNGDAIAEGMKNEKIPIGPINQFFIIWEKINGEESLQSNPWVFIYEFKQIVKPLNF